MNERISIVVGEEDESQAEWLCRCVERSHTFISNATTKTELFERIIAHKPDLVVTDVSLRDGDGLDASTEAYGSHPHALIVVSDIFDRELLDRVTASHANAYLTKPFKSEDLLIAIELAITRWRQFWDVTQQSSDLRQALEDRKIVEQAKGILMKTSNLDEPSAFRRLQKLSQDSGKPLAAVAEMIMLTSKALVQES